LGLQRYEDFLILQIFSQKFSKKWLIFCFQPLFMCLEGGFELFQEPQVVLEIVAEVTDLPLEHGDTLHSHTEGETAVFPAVDA